MTSNEVSEAINSNITTVRTAFVFYENCKYVSGRQDMEVKGKPKRYKLTAKGKKKLRSMAKLKRDHPEQWGKPKID